MAMLAELDSHVRLPSPRQNQATERLPNGARLEGGSRAASASVDLRQAYGFARGIARIQPGNASARPGHRLVWVRRAAFACTTLVAADDSASAPFAVIGRHTQCTVVLPDDPFVALRHVLVRSIALPSGGVALRMIDLHTGIGFVLPDGSSRTAILAEGPIAVAIGEYALVALPTESKGDELPGEMPAPVVDMPAAVRDQLEALAVAMSPYRVNARPANRTSRITLMPCPVMVGDPLPPNLGRLANGRRHVLTLVRGPRSATMMITEEDLARGVVIGRSEKCHSEMLRRITDENTSRVHLLVLREG